MVTAPAGTSFSVSTKRAPFALSDLDHVAIVNDLVAHIDRRAVLGRAPARRYRSLERRRRKSRAAGRE